MDKLIENKEKSLLEELIEDYQQMNKCDIDTATYYTLAILVDAVATGMSPLKGMHNRIFGEKKRIPIEEADAYIKKGIEEGRINPTSPVEGGGKIEASTMLFGKEKEKQDGNTDT